MRYLLALAAFFSLFSFAMAQTGADKIDKNVSVFEGKEFAYVIYPPNGYQTVTDEAVEAGYSMAFIPLGQKYYNANVVIDINIFKLKNMTADDNYVTELVSEDIGQLRKQYGKNLTVKPVDSVFNANGKLLPTFYFNDTTKFTPTVMLSYFNGKSEIIIFQLSIGRTQNRVQAEEIYLNCIRAFKSLTKEDINERSKRLSGKEN